MSALFLFARGRDLKKLREVRARRSRSHRASRKKPTASELIEAKIILFSAPRNGPPSAGFFRGAEKRFERSGFPRRFARVTRAHRARKREQFLRATRRFQGAAAEHPLLCASSEQGSFCGHPPEGERRAFSACLSRAEEPALGLKMPRKMVHF